MSLAGDTITLIGFCKIELPTTTIRICDGGFCYFEGEKYTSEDDLFGSISTVDEFAAALGDSAEDARITFIPATDAAPAQIHSSAFQNARARFWMGGIGADGKTVATAEQQMDGLVDYTVLRLTDEGRELEMAFIGRPEKLFLAQEGNSLNPRHHKSIWPGERGMDNTGSKVTIAWGVGSARGLSSGGGTGGGAFTGRNDFGIGQVSSR